LQEWIEIRDGKRYRVTLLPPKAKLDPPTDTERFYRTRYPFTAYINGKPRRIERAPR